MHENMRLKLFRFCKERHRIPLYMLMLHFYTTNYTKIMNSQQYLNLFFGFLVQTTFFGLII